VAGLGEPQADAGGDQHGFLRAPAALRGRGALLGFSPLASVWDRQEPPVPEIRSRAASTVSPCPPHAALRLVGGSRMCGPTRQAGPRSSTPAGVTPLDDFGDSQFERFIFLQL